MTAASSASLATKLHPAGVAAATTTKTRAIAAATAATAATAAASGAANGAVDAFAALLESMRTDSSTDAGGSVAGSADDATMPGAGARQTEDAEHAAKPVPANALVLLTQSALLLPAPPDAAAVSRGLRATVVGEAGANAAPGAPAGASNGVGDAKPSASNAMGAPALLSADGGPAVLCDSASPHRATERFAALLAQADPARTTSSGEASVSARHHAVEVPSALAAGAPAQGQPPAAEATQAAAATAVHQAALPSRPLDAAFGGDLAAEVRLMVDAGTQRAELSLNPADLGPIHIELSLNAQTADISFAASHSATREGIAQALPALREMLAGQGLSLGHAGVSSGQQGQAFAEAQRQARALPHGSARVAGAVDPAGSAAAPGVISLKAGRGMLDLYA